MYKCAWYTLSMNTNFNIPRKIETYLYGVFDFVSNDFQGFQYITIDY